MSDHPFTQSYIDHIDMLVGQIDRATIVVEQLREENSCLDAELAKCREALKTLEELPVRENTDWNTKTINALINRVEIAETCAKDMQEECESLQREIDSCESLLERSGWDALTNDWVLVENLRQQGFDFHLAYKGQCWTAAFYKGDVVYHSDILPPTPSEAISQAAKKAMESTT
jgi:predicted RNase H-like nuclease (RuvC/YqgF family)